MAKTKKLESGKWFIEVYLGKGHDGKAVRTSFTADTKKEVEQKAAACKVDFERNKKKEKNPYKNMTLAEAMDKYIEIKTPVLSPSTIAGYKNVKKNFFLDIQPFLLCDITNDMIQKSLNNSAQRKTKTTEKNGVSKKTLQNAKGFLSAVLRRYCPEFRMMVDTPQSRGRQTTTFDNAEETVKKLFNLVRGENCELAVLLGMMSFRCSEISGFKKSDVNFETGHITVNRVIIEVDSQRIEKENAKTEKSKRSVALPPYMLNMIANLPGDDCYLVPERQQTYKKRFYSLLDKKNLDHIRFHDLRHLHASITKLLGIPDDLRQEMGGWSNPIIMNGTYTDLQKTERQKADEKVINFFENIMLNSIAN